jgi:hypothetical protein
MDAFNSVLICCSLEIIYHTGHVIYLLASVMPRMPTEISHEYKITEITTELESLMASVLVLRSK